MSIIRKILLLFFLHFVLGINLYSKSFQFENHIKVNKNFELSFNQGDFHQSLFSLFQLVIYYKSKVDTINLYRTWNRISIVNYLLHRKYHGAAAYAISQKYKTDKLMDYRYLCLGYKEVVGCGNSIDNYTEFIADTTDWFLVKSRMYLNFLVLLNRNKEDKIDINTYSECLKLFNRFKLRGDTTWFGYASMNYQIGYYLYYSGKYLKSVSFFLTTQRIHLKNLQFNSELINAYNFLISTDFNLNVIKKQEYFNELNSYFNRGLIQKPNLYFYYICKGEYFNTIRNYNEALSAFLEAIKYCAGLDLRKAYLNIWITGSYYKLGNYDKVIEWHNKCKEPQTADYYGIIANSYFKLGKKSISDLYIAKIVKQISNQEESTKRSLLNLLANYFFVTREFKKAEIYYTNYLKSTIKLYGNYHRITALAYSFLAYFQWIGKGDIEFAIQYYHKEVCSLTNTDFSINVFQIPDVSHSINDEDLARAMRNKAEAFYELSKTQKTKKAELKYLKACLQWFEIAINVVTKHKYGFLKEEQKLVYTDLTKHYYPYIIQASIDLYQKTGDKQYVGKTFEYIEKSKASMLLTMVQGAGARKMDFIPKKLKLKEEVIRTNTLKYLQLLDDENNKVNPDNTNIDTYNTELEQIRQQQDSLLLYYKENFPEYFNICYGNKVIAIDSLHCLIKPGQVIVQYSVSPKMLVVFLISKDTILFRRESIGSPFFTNVEQYRKLVTGFHFSDTHIDSVRAYEDVANRLYRILLMPFEKYFNGRELIIIPDDVLNLIPFEPLVTSKLDPSQKINFRNLNYLIKKYPIGYNYSASLFAYTRLLGVKSLYPSRLLAVAPIGFTYNEAILAKINNSDEKRDGESIMPIPGSAEEAKAAHRIFGGKLLIRKQATESEFKNIASDYSIIHLASHGIVNNKNPMLSKILFVPEKDSVNDGFLNTWEVYSLQLNAPLVVLSACNTGYGKLYKGEGIISLARGFFLAGSQNVVMTLWSVADKTSNRLMQGFYEHLSGSETIDIALKNAKTDYLSDADVITSHPYFWAGYVSIGNPNIKFEKPKTDYTYYYYIMGVLVALIGSLISWRILFRKNRTRRI